MWYASIILFALGIIIGTRFRLKFLVGMILIVFAISVVVAWSQAHDLKEAALIVAGAQIIFQFSYFAGLVCRPFLSQRKMKPSGFVGATRRFQQDRDS
jgi:hypothetical protein